ncbi:DUF6788 family protein [Mycobacterium ostraviense]|uniref:DUF6788 family protein n=1 Tax=Mycobacterium ostraviense TaxID=2738409 RepID=UPI001911D598|nr:DUF6788 family protein [Mycobacterium ostraviense]UGT93265.1 hypothetical protein LTS72_08235 [Mycobacterium ostraviense]
MGARVGQHELGAVLGGTADRVCLGFIATGTVIERSTRCGTPGCRCHAEPPQLHGPYHQWTTKSAGKTVTRRLTSRQAALYREWIDNNRRLRQLIEQMRQISARAAELILPPDTPAT